MRLFRIGLRADERRSAQDALLEAHAAAAPIVDAINALAPHVDVPRIHEERARLDALASQAAQRHVSQLIEFFGGRNLRDDEDPSSKRDRGRAQDRAFFDVIEAVSSELDGDERAVKAAAARAVEALGRDAMAKLHQTTRGATADVLMNYEYYSRGAAPYRCRTGRLRSLGARRASILR